MKILAAGLARQHKVAVCVVGSGDRCDGDSESAFYRGLDIPVHFLGLGQKLKHRTYAAKIQTALRLRKRIGAFEPEIVHAFGQPATLIAAAVLLKERKTKLFSSVLSKWQPHTIPIKNLEGYWVNRVDRFVAPHRCLQNELRIFGVSDEKFSIVSNGVLPQDNETSKSNADHRQRGRALLMQQTGLPSTALIAVTAADLLPATRLKDLIWATDLLSCVRNDVHLVIMGKGSQHQNLLNFASCTEAADHIHLVGLPSTALAMISGADVYWNSHLQTPVPSAMLAAMNCGVPVISVYGPETSSVVIHQETGFAVNFGARDEFARWMKFLIEKPDSAQQLARQGQQHVRDLFDSATLVSAIDNLLAK